MNLTLPPWSRAHERRIRPNETFVYRFPVRQSGTYWYHSHSRFQEQTEHCGALVIDPGGTDPIGYDRDYVIILPDRTDEDPETVLSNLKQQSDYYNCSISLNARSSGRSNNIAVTFLR